MVEGQAVDIQRFLLRLDKCFNQIRNADIRIETSPLFPPLPPLSPLL